jgi:hypothetical protein
MPHIGPYYHKKQGFKQVGVWGWDRDRMWSKINTVPDANGCHNAGSAMSPTGALMGAWKFPEGASLDQARQQMTQMRRLVWMDINNIDATPYQITLKCHNQKCCNPEHFVVKPTNKRATTSAKVKAKTKQERWWG